MHTATVIQTSVQPSVGPSTAAGADKNATAGGAQSAFAGALNAAGARPGRRSGASRQSDDGASGGSLPPTGNQSPPVPSPPAATAAAIPPHANGSSPADRPRTERGKEKGSTPAENPLAAQAAAAVSAAAVPVAAAAAAAAAMIDGTKSTGNTIAAGPAGATSAAVALGGQPTMEAKIEPGLAAKSAAAAAAAAARPHPVALRPVAKAMAPRRNRATIDPLRRTRRQRPYGDDGGSARREPLLDKASAASVALHAVAMEPGRTGHGLRQVPSQPAGNPRFDRLDGSVSSAPVSLVTPRPRTTPPKCRCPSVTQCGTPRSGCAVAARRAPGTSPQSRKGQGRQFI
jgi:hypothetical protein